MTRQIKKLSMLLITLLLLTGFTYAHGLFGIRTGLYEEIDEMYLGAEWMHRASERIEFNPNLEYVIIPESRYVALNWDANYNLVNSKTGFIEAGGGLALIFINDEALEKDEMELGINTALTAGLVIHGRYLPYVQAKYVFNNAIKNQLVVGLGMRFRLSAY